jgi:hypothetical protein
MKLWLIYPIKTQDEYHPCDAYDTAQGFVVRAKSAKRARQIASDFSGDEGKDTWLLSEKSCCLIIPSTGDEKMVLRSFKAG